MLKLGVVALLLGFALVVAMIIEKFTTPKTDYMIIETEHGPAKAYKMIQGKDGVWRPDPRQTDENRKFNERIRHGQEEDADGRGVAQEPCWQEGDQGIQ